MLTMANTYRMPISGSVPCRSKLTSPKVSVPPQGITTPVSRAVIMAMAGPSTKSLRLAMAGMKSSFMIIFSPSATGCRRPKGPARLGPIRSCMKAATLRSPKVA